MNEALQILQTYWPNGLFILLAVLFNSGMDSLRHSFTKSFAKNWDVFFWDPTLSWLNKYVDRDREKGRRKIWFIVIPAALTDGWHLLKMFMLGFMFIAASLNVTGTLLTDIYLFIFYQAIWNVLFNPIYYKLRKW